MSLAAERKWEARLGNSINGPCKPNTVAPSLSLPPPLLALTAMLVPVFCEQVTSSHWSA